MEDQSPPPPPPPHHKTYKLTTCSVSYTKSATSTNAANFLFKSCTQSSPTYILKDISFTALPSQILAIVGPSGAGKSTLLDILASRISPTYGSLLLNSSPLTPSTFRKLSAYVPQHDASLPLLTVHETFIFTARLLIANASQIHSIVDSLLADLHLTHISNTRLANNLSGGERRRISIGLSLLHDPSVLLLDEPTSGLDSSSAFSVMQTLQSIAVSRSRTIILSIHQPSFKILSTIDSILLLSKGSVIHHGTLPSLESFLLSAGFTVPPQLNVLEYTMEILHQLQGNQPQSLPLLTATAIEASQPIKYRSSRIHEICTLYSRFWKIIYRTRQLLLTNTLEALVVGIVLGSIYINVEYNQQGIDKRFGFFAFTLTFLLSSTTETLPIFISERPIILRETSSGVYRLSSHLIANTLVFMPYLLLISLIYSLSVYFLVGLCLTWQAFSYFLLVIWIVVLMANSFVLFLSSLAPTYVAGTSLVTIFLGAFFLFSGYFISCGSIPKYWLFMHYVSMYKYALDAFLINEYTCIGSRCLVRYDDNTDCMVNGYDVLKTRGIHEGQKWSNIYILIAFFVLYRLLCLVVLSRRASRSKK